MKTNINIKVDENIRDDVKVLFNQMGLDMTTAVNMFFLAALREKGLPFSVTTIASTNEKEALQSLINKIKASEQEENDGKMRSYDSFASEMKKKYEIK